MISPTIGIYLTYTNWEKKEREEVNRISELLFFTGSLGADVCAIAMADGPLQSEAHPSTFSVLQCTDVSYTATNRRRSLLYYRDMLV
jgi:hypothetical protein